MERAAKFHPGFEKYDYNQKNEIYISHSEYPDTFVKHIPEMDMISFICNFGGLLNMWLGLSIFGIFNDTFSLFSKIAFHKYTSTNRVTNVQCKFILIKNRILNRIHSLRPF